MKRPSVTSSLQTKPGDIVVVPFPFVERAGARRRPALVLSTRRFNDAGHAVLAMITTSSHATWPGDVMITDLTAAGLRVECRVRLKLFTLDNRLIVRRIGRLARGDLESVSASLSRHLMPRPK